MVTGMVHIASKFSSGTSGSTRDLTSLLKAGSSPKAESAGPPTSNRSRIQRFAETPRVSLSLFALLWGKEKGQSPFPAGVSSPAHQFG